jgi:hypothetical protein
MPMKNPPHPGLSVRHDCLEPLGISVTQEAKILGVTRQALTINRTGSCRLFQSPISIALKFLLRKNFGGGGGNRTPVRESSISVTTCLAVVLISLFEPPAAGSLGASRFRSQPHPLRQRNQPIPLNDALSDPVGENR